MDKKKLIGMFIGIIMFAALIAGATFAWLTFTANFTNNVISGNSRDFTFEYEQGTAVSNLIWTTSSPPRKVISVGNGYITVDVTKAAKVPEASSFKIILNKTTMEIGVENLIRYAVCLSDTKDDSDCKSAEDIVTPIPTTVGGKWVALGSVTTETGTQVLYNDTTTFNVYSENNEVEGYYYIYFWLDSAVLTNDNLPDVENKTIAGYVYAEAEQGETGTVQ